MKRVLKWMAWGVGVSIVLVLLVFAVGLVLPVDHTARASAVFDAAPEDVWALISDLEGSASWRDGVDRVERLPDDEGRPVYREISDFGALDLRVDLQDPPRRMVGTIVGEGLPFGGTWTYELTPTPAGTRLTITERGEVYSPLFRFFSRFVFGHYGTIESYLASLGQRLGRAVDVRREPVSG